MAGQYTFRTIGNNRRINSTPFRVIPYDGQDVIPGGQNFAVSNGILFSSAFTYDSGAYIPIQNMNQPFILKRNDVVYIDVTVLSNMQVSGAEIRVGPVGNLAPTEAKNTPDDEMPNAWVDYPDFYRIRPQDVRNPQTNIITEIKDGKKQQKCYIMLGKCVNQLNDCISGSINYPYFSISGDTQGPIYFIQYTNNDMMMFGSNVSGVPITYPMPYMGGPATSDSNQLFANI